jgi:hypothetical protein
MLAVADATWPERVAAAAVAMERKQMDRAASVLVMDRFSWGVP